MPRVVLKSIPQSEYNKTGLQPVSRPVDLVHFFECGKAPPNTCNSDRQKIRKEKNLKSFGGKNKKNVKTLNEKFLAGKNRAFRRKYSQRMFKMSVSKKNQREV